MGRLCLQEIVVTWHSKSFPNLESQWENRTGSCQLRASHVPYVFSVLCNPNYGHLNISQSHYKFYSLSMKCHKWEIPLIVWQKFGMTDYIKRFLTTDYSTEISAIKKNKYILHYSLQYTEYSTTDTISFYCSLAPASVEYKQKRKTLDLCKLPPEQNFNFIYRIYY